MVYIFVLFTSAIGLAVLLSGRTLMRNRSLRKFVRSIRYRSQSAADRGALIVADAPPPPKSLRPQRKAVAFQEVRLLIRDAEKAMARQLYTDAERFLISALTIRPEDRDVKIELAKLYLMTERPAKAEAIYLEVLAKGIDACCLANLGLAYYQQQKFNESYECYSQAHKLEATPERSFALARVCLALQKYDEAVVLLEKARVRFPRDVELLRLLALAYEQIGNATEACETYRRINRLEPYDETVKAKLSLLASA